MLAVLPHVTAGLNALAGVLLLIGFSLIKTRHQRAHRLVMTAAVITSVLFLAAYLLHHFTAPVFIFPGQGLVRPLYFTMLISHVGLAILVTPMAALTFLRARRGDFALHRGLARWTFPVWIYVSATGILVYILLYHVYRPVGV
ncbi:DUF420 domain-containing protein [Telmatospirillum siberiense]|uniref:DUF420 domain-containing protein n=1 Tax=Telmatospirillum siberiense TaxID=382514 RepID=A0A2N3PR32_9PROT|nr:DUF420 domain-containing protein [Telmatospirillum siberiense]PKU22870.1 DUF420 domain-containing protein [Telmatospirillum siberiense]